MTDRTLKSVICIIAMSIALSGFAFDSVILWLKSGTRIIIPFSDKPEISFADNNITINNRTFDFNQVSKYTIGGTSSVELINADGKNIALDENGDIIIQDESGIADVSVYDIDGIQYNCEITSLSNGYVKIALASLAPQIYIIKVGTNSFKIQKS